MLKWRDVEVGQHVKLAAGDPYVVEKIKTKGKVTKVTASGKRGRFTREVKAKAEVEVFKDEGKHSRAHEATRRQRATLDRERPVPTGGPRNDERGVPRRWAEPGDAEYTRPPKKAKGGPWDKPSDKAEKNVTKMLGATLVGATGDADKGWYVPEQGADTLAAHLLLFHDVTVEANDYATMTRLHDDEHARAKVAPFSPLHINHWHTKERPEL